MATCTERLGSRRVSADNQATTVETTWLVDGTNDETAAQILLLSTVPPIYVDSINSRTLFRQSHSVEQTGYQLWECVVNYARPDDTDPEEWTFSFDATGGTARVTQSLGTTRYPANAPDFKGAIGVQKDSIEGVEIGVSELKFSEVHSMPAALFTPAYIDTLVRMKHHTNAEAWRVWDAEQVIFVGGSGQSQPDGMVQVTYNFEVGVHLSDHTIGTITGIEKKAWQYLWTYYADSEDTTAKELTKAPLGVYVEDIYETADFNLLGV